ncbi:MAG: riboflavin biosynthesis protein RibD, partial [gamma proteobacterium symbiont of Ctena orbiculata]
MARAIQLAKRGWYSTHPNPRVGCLIVKDGEVIAEGFHRRAGEPHAERNALADAGVAARGATLYVTLEPCCHQGRTPPCTDALIESGVKRVVVAMPDPNPLVAGRGMELLRQAGIQVTEGVMRSQAEALNPGFIKRMTRGLPLIRCKMAMSLDGRTAMADGESQWITSPAARADVQRLRAQSAAILTGVGTLLADDPGMNVRLSG